jgi:hypothetical protein
MAIGSQPPYCVGWGVQVIVGGSGIYRCTVAAVYLIPRPQRGLGLVGPCSLWAAYLFIFLIIKRRVMPFLYSRFQF